MAAIWAASPAQWQHLGLLDETQNSRPKGAILKKEMSRWLTCPYRAQNGHTHIDPCRNRRA